jgi:hypothetical protein
MNLPIAIEALRLVPKLRGLRTEVVEQRSNGGVRGRRVRWRSPRWPRRLPGADPAGEPGQDPEPAAVNGAEARTQTRG